jgi:hypothetical protein
MLKTPLCDLLGIDLPVICAPFGPWHEVDLAARTMSFTDPRLAVVDDRRRVTSIWTCGKERVNESV